MLYEVALVEQPSKKDAMEKLIMSPKPVIARDEQSAGVIAVLDNKDSITCDMSRVQVLVRPFV